MTIVVGLVTPTGDVLMGADTAGTGGWSQQVRRDYKVKRVGDMLIGFTTSYRMGQLLHWRLVLPTHHLDVSVDEYMHTLFIDAVRDLFKQHGYAHVDSNREEGGTFLVGYRGRLFKIDSDYQIAEHAEPYDTCGSGEDLAIGSMYTTGLEALRNKRLSPHERVRIAIETACKFNAGCNGNIQIETIKSNDITI